MRGKFGTWVVIGFVVVSLSSFFPNSYTPPAEDTSTVDPWAEPTELPSDEATDPALEPGPDATDGTDLSGAAFWSTGFTAVDVTDRVNRDCTEFEMCVFVKVKTTNTCSAITLTGSIYDADDNYIDSFEQDFAALKAGKTRTVEFGTDILDDNEDYVEFDDATCYK